MQVFAGYVDDMDKFIQANAGMFRRVNYTFDFEDYSAHELAEILLMSCRAKGFDFEAGATAEGIVSRERGGHDALLICFDRCGLGVATIETIGAERAR